ncbi:MAG TPA: aquaporin [Actinomycetota bacterium]|nr:aquaporin [Actinomycetota bacterium]
MDASVAHAPPVHEEAGLGRRLLAEFVGTLVFVAVGTGAATVALLGPLREFTKVSESAGGQLGPQEQFVRSLLESGYGDVLPIAFAFATALAVLVYALGGVSGAHFNPAVTFALAVARRFSWKDLPLYLIAQCAGAIAGAFVIAGIYGGGEPSGGEVFFGATVIAENVNEWQALLAEAFIAFVLVTAIMAVAVDPRAPKGWSGLIIGLSLAGGILVTGAATGGSANFARSLGPFVVSLFYDTPDIPWGDLIIYAAGPLIGGAAAALVYETVTGLEDVSPAPHPGAATGSEDGVEEALVHEHEAHHHAPGESHAHSHGSDLHSHPHDHESGPGHDHPH